MGGRVSWHALTNAVGVGSREQVEALVTGQVRRMQTLGVCFLSSAPPSWRCCRSGVCVCEGGGTLAVSVQHLPVG